MSDAIIWLKNLKADIGKTEHQSLWHYEQALSEIIEELEKADRPQGEWKRVSPAYIYACSECGGNVMTQDIECYKYCHQCGAEMKGADNE